MGNRLFSAREIDQVAPNNEYYFVAQMNRYTHTHLDKKYFTSEAFSLVENLKRLDELKHRYRKAVGLLDHIESRTSEIEKKVNENIRSLRSQIRKREIKIMTQRTKHSSAKKAIENLYSDYLNALRNGYDLGLTFFNSQKNTQL